jgi:hypothetical protein
MQFEQGASGSNLFILNFQVNEFKGVGRAAGI